jgi:hypothetical protein
MASFFGFEPQQAGLGSGYRSFGWAENHKYQLGLVLLVATLALYHPVHRYPFISGDD